MANRIILSAVVTLALTLLPGLAHSVPTQSEKKKAATKSQSKTVSKSKSSKKSRTYRSRSTNRQGAGVVVESSMVPKSSAAAAVPETKPLIKVTPQRDGSFKLEPLSPKKPVTPITRPSYKPESGRDQTTAAEPQYNRFEPWNFSELVLSQANYYKDTPYARGGSLAKGYATDCSGFVQYIYHGFKINLPRSSAEQAQVGKVVCSNNMDYAKLLPGDLLFFRRGGRWVGHSGIYLGEGKMIHASNRRNGVTVTDLRQPYYEGTFVVAKRVFVVQFHQ